jgi:hypothetical protein
MANERVGARSVVAAASVFMVYRKTSVKNVFYRVFELQAYANMER